MKKYIFNGTSYAPEVPEGELALWKAQGELGAKNLILFPYSDGNGKTTNGMTFSVNADGSVVANGTSTDWTSFRLVDSGLILSAGEYIFSAKGLAKNTYVTVKDVDANVNYNCEENRLTINLTFDTDTQIRVFIQTQPNVTLDNFVFYPMLRLASDPDDTWTPYAPSNKDLYTMIQALQSGNASLNANRGGGESEENSDS